jgi:starch-binding outer membrane protein, SusD/RagB family
MEKNNNQYKGPWLVFLCATLAVCSCNKNALLNAKPQTSLVIPSTIQDFQAILDDDEVMNITPCLGEESADNYYVTYTNFQARSVVERNTYTWASDIFAGTTGIPDWDLPYQQALNANVVLEGLAGMAVTSDNQQDINTLMGYALFYRSYAFFNISQAFAPVYDSATASADLGIPLRLSSDVNATSVRSTIDQTYNQILSDLNTASRLTPAAFRTVYRNRPSKPAVYALEARVYQSMGAYVQAGAAADSALQLYNTLIDYNTVSSTNFFPFENTNAETIFQSSFPTSELMLAPLIGVAIIDSTLYASYDSNDLRRTLFFSVAGGLASPRTGYSGTIFPFSGLATDELYLERAESYARAGQTTLAMNDLNTLLVYRHSGIYTPLTATDPTDALNKVLTERRKEIVMRGLRWTDLRRLNREGYNITPERILNGQTYTLAPNSPPYALPIPPDVISLSGMVQNQR